MIGTFGGIIFSVDGWRVLTPSKISRTVKGRWASHETIGRKTASQYLSPDLQSVSLEITLRADMGVRPRTMLERLERIVEQGTVSRLIIGGRPVGRNYFRLVSISEEWNTVFSGGELFSASVSLSLEEYA